MNNKIKVNIIVPTYNSENHIINFLENLYIYLNKLEYDWCVTIVDDSSKDGTYYKIIDFLEGKEKKKWNFLKTDHNIGQQKSIWVALKNLKNKNVVVVVDDDMLITDVHIQRLIESIHLGRNEVSIVHQKAKGLRNITSGIYWLTYQLVVFGKFEGRELMLRAMSPEFIDRILRISDGSASISQISNELTRKIERISDINVEFLGVKSRYSFTGRVLLFLELIITKRQELGVIIGYIGSVLYFLSIGTMIILSLFDKINIFSTTSILTIILITIGYTNLIVLGIIQFSLASLRKKIGDIH